MIAALAPFVWTDWLPTAAGILLITLGVACFVLEIKVVSYGVLTIIGIGLCIAGLTLLLEEVPWRFVIPAFVGIAAIVAFLTVMALRVRSSRPLGDASEIIGRIVSVAADVNADGGKVVVDGVKWNAVSSAPIRAGAKARVVGVNGLVLAVEPGGEPRSTT